MARFITYVMAAAVGLVIAMAVGLPALLTIQAPGPDNAPAAPTDEIVHPGTVPQTGPRGALPGEAGAPPAIPVPDGTYASEQETSAPNAAPAGVAAHPLADNQTVLAAVVTSGSVVAVVNGQAMDALEDGQTYDLSPFVRSGQNTIVLRWSGPVQAELRVSHAATAGAFRDAGQAFLTLAGTQSPGTQTLVFFL